MNTPIIDFVKNYNSKKTLRLHMPGHKGKRFLGCEPWDITEIEGADVLYNAKGIIKKSEDNAARLFGTDKTLYSTEGSSLAIRAMLYLVKIYGNSSGKRAFIAAGRNAHKAFVTAAALLEFEVDWLMPQKPQNLISLNITPCLLENYLKSSTEKPLAVYVTSPDYLGNMSDIKGLAEVCKKYGTLLLVDNAHGAYLSFLPQNCHPIELGADICCDSAHKTLPVLTGGAYLHIAKTAPKIFSQMAENAMSVFATTSPSYLILQSLDLANRYISEGYREKLAEFIKQTEALKRELQAFGYTLCGNEPLKLTIAPKPYGYYGYELAERLSKKNMECEFADPDFVVLMLNENLGEGELLRIKEALLSIEKKAPILKEAPVPEISERRFSLKEAIFLPSKEIAVEEGLGKALATASVSCPPAIPIAVSGEKITPKAIECFKYYDIKTCYVIETE